MVDRSTTIVVVSVILPLLAVLAVILRFSSRRTKSMKYQLDDYLMIPAVLLTVGVGINNIVGATVGRIGKHEVLNSDDFPVGDHSLLVYGQVMFVLQILHTCAIPVIKASILCFYRRLFSSSSRAFNVAIWIIAVYVTLWFISILFATIFQCKPISDNWGTQESELSGCLPTIIYMYQTAAITNVISDLAILVVPWPIVWKLHMATHKKIAVSGIFLLGALVVVAGIGRTVAYFKLSYSTSVDFSYNDFSLVTWTVVEPSLGVISACLPTLRPLFAGLSPESVIESVRSRISLRSFRSQTFRSEEDQERLKNERGQTSSEGFTLTPEKSSKENQTFSGLVLDDSRRQNEVKDGGLVVQKGFSQNDERV